MHDNDRMNSILEIAFDLFLEKGYSATSIRTICQLAEIEAPTLYYFFNSKKGLFDAIATRLWNGYNLFSSDVLKKLADMEPLKKLYFIYRFSINYALTNPHDIKFYIRYSLFPPEELADNIKKHLRNLQLRKEQMTMKAIVEFIDKGIIKIEFLKAQYQYWNFINHCIYDVIFSEWKPDEDELIETWHSFVKYSYEIDELNYINKIKQGEFTNLL
ncbi:MAG: hypothetical protein A2Y17_01105 [Clostridiales bacterium GWF2_38_85]|nr:MAG: hypothetical protein A2Y17_01105 [Clostridiales bacterium GWF2_38_85]HBL84513.1 hypothetical protein [Clostridiales bacterium]